MKVAMLVSSTEYMTVEKLGEDERGLRKNGSNEMWWQPIEICGINESKNCPMPKIIIIILTSIFFQD